MHSPLTQGYSISDITSSDADKAADFAFQEFGLIRITANIFAFNLGSARVLEKAGFQCEGILRKHYKKDGKTFDGKLYAKIKAD